MNVAATKVCKSIAFSAISTGVYGFPKEQAVAIAVEQVYRELPRFPFLRHVVFCCFDEDMLNLYQAELEKYQTPDDS